MRKERARCGQASGAVIGALRFNNMRQKLAREPANPDAHLSPKQLPRSPERPKGLPWEPLPPNLSPVALTGLFLSAARRRHRGAPALRAGAVAVLEAEARLAFPFARGYAWSARPGGEPHRRSADAQSSREDAARESASGFQATHNGGMMGPASAGEGSTREVTSPAPHAGRGGRGRPRSVRATRHRSGVTRGAEEEDTAR